MPLYVEKHRHRQHPEARPVLPIGGIDHWLSILQVMTTKPVVMTGGAEMREARAALERQLSSLDGEPSCTLCRADADFFLYEPDRVAKFVCWEHVSPVSAAVDLPVETTNRPVALPLTEEFS